MKRSYHAAYFMCTSKELRESFEEHSPAENVDSWIEEQLSLSAKDFSDKFGKVSVAMENVFKQYWQVRELF